MNSYKKLVNNSVVFAIGNFGTKFISFFLLPLYTYYLTKTEFGLVDLLTTTLSLLLPLFTLSIFDSVLRFTMDKSYDKQSVLINSLMVTIFGFILSIIIYPLFARALPFDGLLIYFYVLLFIQLINATLSQYVRALGMLKLFALSGIINAFILLISNIFFLIVFDLGIIGYLISLIIANIATCLFLIDKGNLKYDFNIKKINIKLTKEMLLYSIPLLPNALMWWIMGLSDRFLITYFLGLGANGLYAVANKIPSILNMINSIFFQAWQMSAIEEFDSKEKSKFFTNVFNIFSITMLVSTSVILVFLKFIMDILIADNYFEAWKYVPFLLLGVVFSSFSGFLGTNYIAAKKTKGVFKTSVIGALINIIINIILIPKIGVYGAAIGTMISFAVIWLLRIRDTKVYVDLKINYKKLGLTFIALCVQIKLLYMNLNYDYLFQLCILILIVLFNFSEIKILITRLCASKVKKYTQSKKNY